MKAHIETCKAQEEERRLAAINKSKLKVVSALPDEAENSNYGSEDDHNIRGMLLKELHPSLTKAKKVNGFTTAATSDFRAALNIGDTQENIDMEEEGVHNNDLVGQEV